MLVKGKKFNLDVRTGLDDGQTWSSNKNNLDSEDDWQHSDVKQLLEQTK